MSGRGIVDALLRSGQVMRALESMLMGADPREEDGARAVDGMLERVDAIGDWCPGCGRSRSPRADGDAGHGAREDPDTRFGRDRRDGPGRTNTCEDCSAGRVSASMDAAPWPLVRLGRYEGHFREAVLAAKRDLSPERIGLIGRRLGEQWRAVVDELARARPEVGRAFRAAVVQPVPMPWLRRWERGSDHARLIALGFAEATGFRIDRLVVQRWGTPRARQRGLDRRTDRPDSPGAARFFPRRRWWRPGNQSRRPVVIVDDVRTSGSTLRAMATTLRSAGFGPISAAVIAVAHGGDRPP